MDAQEIFDIVAKHLAQQRGQSMNADGCAYRGDNGRKCAVGCLITDAEYRATMEGINAMHANLPSRFSRLLGLLCDLQDAHDRSSTGAAVAAKLRTAALQRDLSPAILDSLTFPVIWA